MITGIRTEYEPDAGSTKDTPYLALTGELWSFFREYFENIVRVITAPYCICHCSTLRCPEVPELLSCGRKRLIYVVSTIADDDPATQGTTASTKTHSLQRNNCLCTLWPYYQSSEALFVCSHIFGQTVIRIYNCLSIDKEEMTFIPKITGYFGQTG